MNFQISNLKIFDVANRSRAISFIIEVLCAAIFLSFAASMTNAAITWSGDVNPADPTTWTASTKAYVGQSSAGAITVDGGSGLLSNYGYLGNISNSSSTGVATVSGIGSTWINNGAFCVWSGALYIEAGGQVSNQDGFVGSKISTGTATVTGSGSTWTNSDDLYIINPGSTLNVADGGAVTARALHASLTNLFGNGVIAIQGAVLDTDLTFDAAHGLQQTLAFGAGGTLNLNLDGSGALGAGCNETGTLRVADGITVTSKEGILGETSGSSGTATIVGVGSMWNSGHLNIGRFGNGIMKIEAGGQVNSANGSLGNSAGSTGTVTVTGSGSKWTPTRLSVGVEGGGTLNIEAGAQVQIVGISPTGAADTHLGTWSGSSGTVTVTGNGSMLSNSSVLLLGEVGDGILNIGTGIASGGTVVVDTLTLASANSSIGICNLNGGTLQARNLNRGDGTAIFNWIDGTIQLRDIIPHSNDANNLVLKLAATGTHSFNVEANTRGTFDAILSDATSGGTLEKRGAGLLILTAANTYTGGTMISEGMLRLSSTGTLASSLIDVGGGATFDISAKTGGFTLGAGKTLKGSGTVAGSLIINGIHAPGSSPGIETVKGNYSMLGELQIELMGTAAGTGYDQVLVSGVTGNSNVALGGMLALDWSGMNGSTNSTKLWIIRNDTFGTLSGTFGNYANGAALGMYDGRDWRLWYGADAATGNLFGGNDVAIAAVPEPMGVVLLGIGALLLLGWACRRR